MNKNQRIGLAIVLSNIKRKENRKKLIEWVLTFALFAFPFALYIWVIWK